MIPFFGLGREQIAERVRALGAPAFRAEQVYAWLYQRRVRSFDLMTDLDRSFRAALAADGEITWPSVAEKRRSTDGTIKYLLALADGAAIEAVYIPEPRRRTLCISTQAGCPLKCAFCLTGITGYRRNLTVGEILGQVAVAMADAPEREEGWNVVMMGMGEPLLNADATLKALRILMDPRGFGISPRKLTLSTVGIVPAMEKLMAEPVRPNLAISLHAPNARLREKLMPIEAKHALRDVVAAAARYDVPRGGRVTYEYVLLGGVNDTTRHARELASLLGAMRCKVNLIPLNPAPEIPFEAPKRDAVAAFVETLRRSRIAVSVRKPRGQDILAACGQLHLTRRSAGATSAAAAVV